MVQIGQLRPSAVAAEISRERSFAPTLLRSSRPQLTPARGGYRLRAGRPISPSVRSRQPALLTTIRRTQKSAAYSLVNWRTFCAWQYRANHNEVSDENCPPAEPVSIAEPSIRLTLIHTHLTREQLECLNRCAKGISVRFEHWEIVDALIVGGYAEKGVAGTITVTAKGQQYLRTHAS